ncbi:citrate synthase [bacterium]|nr:MAG: citrate synthase [bacterium]
MTTVVDVDLSQYPYINKGLEGIVAFTTNKSFIDGVAGELIYGGYNINTLAENSTFEEVCFLLWEDRLPTTEELNTLKKALQENRELPENVINFIKSVNKKAEPMSVLRTAVSMLADEDENRDFKSHDVNYERSVKLTAKIPTIIAAFHRVREGHDIVAPLKTGSTSFNFLYMLNGVEPGEKAEKVFDLCLILHAEHGMNASTFTARAVCSTEADIYSAVTGAIGSLKGPLHGGANTAVMNMLLELQKQPNPDPVEFVKGKLARKEKIMGFGHRVYKTFDPRAHHLQKLAKALAEETGHVELYEWSMAILNTMKSEKNIDPNVDFFSATVYYSMGIMPDLYTAIFALSRISGWAGHFMEQMENNRLIRPKALFMLEKNKKWTAIENR